MCGIFFFIRVILNQPKHFVPRIGKITLKIKNKRCRGENVRLVAAEVRSRSFSVSLQWL